MNIELAMSILFKCLPHAPDTVLDYEESEISYELENLGLVCLNGDGFLVTTLKGEQVLIEYRYTEHIRKRAYAAGFAAGKADA